MTTIETTVPKDNEGRLAWLLDISEQIKKANEGNEQSRNVGKALDKSSVLVNDNAELIAELAGNNVEDIFALGTLLAKYAEVMAPKTATTIWKDENVQKVLKYLLMAQEIGDLSDEQGAVLDDINATVAKSTTRTPRGPAQTIEGRPSRVTLTQKGEKEPVGNLSGNTRSSAGNIASRVASLTGVDKDTEEAEYAIIRNLANQAVDGRSEAVVYKNITMTPDFTEEDE
jgi:hypothetical protein